MDIDNPIFNFIKSLFLSGPTLLVYFGGLFLAYTNYNRHPRRSTWAAGGIGILLATTLGGKFFYRIFDEMQLYEKLGDISPQTFYDGVGFCWGLFDAVGIALLVLAVFKADDRAFPGDAPRY